MNFSLCVNMVGFCSGSHIYIFCMCMGIDLLSEMGIFFD